MAESQKAWHFTWQCPWQTEVSARLPRGFREDSARFPRGFRKVSARYPRGFREVSARFPRSFREVSARFPQDFRGVSARFREVSARFPQGFREVSARNVAQNCPILPVCLLECLVYQHVVHLLCHYTKCRINGSSPTAK